MTLRSLFQPQSFARVTLCSPPFLVIPNLGIFSCGNKSAVYPLHLSSTKALFSFYIKIKGEGWLRVRLKTTERQENNNRSTQRTVVERDSLRWGSTVVHVGIAGLASRCKKGILRASTLTKIPFSTFPFFTTMSTGDPVLTDWVYFPHTLWLKLTSSVPFVCFLVGHVEHEQTAETTTDSKNHDGVWETGLDNFFAF